MCGIFGVHGAEDARGLERCARMLAHRGPDGFGHLHDAQRRVYLAHCRLAVIDLSPAGRQPMCNEDGSLWLTYNGEIYNFRELRDELVARGHEFRSGTDTEVVLHAYEEWGTACLQRFNGMFAFALWDQRRDHLFMARDRLGIKPLYYARIGGRFAFASEAKALVELPGYQKAVHHPALFSFLMHRYVAGEKSVWEGIHRLLPGHYLLYDGQRGALEIHRYWQLRPETRIWSEGDAVERFEELMGSAVSGQLIADVPVGVFLSGGLDSTCVSLFASRQAVRCDTFSIGFDGSENSELETARVTAEQFGTQHHEETVRADNFEGLKDLFYYYDEPLGDVSVFPTYLVAAAARRRVTVALSGDGGDELFGGYNWYTQTVRARPLKRLAFQLGGVLRMLGLHRTALGQRADRLEHYRRMAFPGFRVEELRDLFRVVAPADAFPESDTYLYDAHYRPDLPPYKRWQYVDAHTFLVDDNLVKVDRASMAHSLEVRVPFLDHRLVEFAFGLVDDLCVREGTTKYLLRRVLERNGVGHVLGRPKQGFSFSLGNFWSPRAIEGELRTGMLVEAGLVDPAGLDRLLEGPGAYNRSAQLWQLMALELWARTWLVDGGSRSVDRTFPLAEAV